MPHSAYRTLTLLLLSSLFAAPGAAQIITTIAGNAINDGRPATDTTLVKPHGVWVDAQGNLIIADAGNFVVRRVNASTLISSVLAGGGTKLDDAIPIPGKDAALDFPAFVVSDTAGNIYFSDVRHHRVRRINTSGQVSTVAGTGESGYDGDKGKATFALLDRPLGLALDSAGNLYIADSGNFVVRRLNLSTGIIDTVAGDFAATGGTGDNGPALKAGFSTPWGLALDSAGNLYISDAEDHRVRKVNTAGTITTVAGKGVADFSGDGGPATSATLDSPKGLAVDAQGNLYIADWGNLRVRRVGPDGVIRTFAGSSDDSTFGRDGLPATQTFLIFPAGVAVDRSGNVFISEERFNLVRRVDTQGVLRTYAGTRDVLDGGAALNAPLALPWSITLDGNNLLIADTEHFRIRRIDSTGKISTVAGNGKVGFSGDGGPATAAALSFPYGVGADAQHNILIADTYNHRVRRVNIQNGIIGTVAGNGNDGFSGDGGPALSASMNSPAAVVADSQGNLYISDYGNDRIRRVASNGTISTIAGNGRSGYSGDGGPALSASLSSPLGLFLDAQRGFLYVADSNNAVVRRINLGTGIITTVAGTGSCCYSGDEGPANQADLTTPTSVWLDAAGRLFIADPGAEVIRMVDATGVITTVAGTGDDGYSGDGGLAVLALLNTPTGVAVDSSGNLYIADTDNSRIRRVSAGAAVTTELAVDPTTLSFSALQGGTAPTAQGFIIKNAQAGPMSWSLTASTSSGGNWLRVSATSGVAPSGVRVEAQPGTLGPGTYNGSIVVTAPGAGRSPATISVTLTVSGPANPLLALSARFLNFQAVQGGASPSPRILSLVNNGSGALNWSVQTLTQTGGNWLKVTPSSGSAPANPVVSVDPTGLTPGLYLGLVSFTNPGTGQSAAVAVSLTVSAPATSIQLSQHSFFFTGTEGSLTIAAQNFRVLNAGQGTMNWNIVPVIGQGNWLRVAPASGVSDASAPAKAPVVTLSVDPSGLTAGTYGALLVINAPGATNNPQFANVALRILPQGSAPAPSVTPAGLVFTAATGSASAVQEVTVSSTGGAPLTFAAATRTDSGGSWLTVSPRNGTVSGSSDPAKVRVQVTPGTLAAGGYQGAVTFSFSNGTVLEVGVLNVLTPATAASKGERAAAACAPSKQFITQTRLVNNFAILVGWPSPLLARVTDDCGNSVTTSTVTTGFSTGDPTLVLQNLRDGQYSGTWTPLAASGRVTVTTRALHASLPEATQLLSGSLDASSSFPAVFANGAVNGASFTRFAPLTPGGIFSVFGSNLSDRTDPYFADRLPLSTKLGSISVKIGGVDAPLFYAASGQINAQVPFELAGMTSAALAVTVRGITTTPETENISTAQPGIFSINSSGSGQGVVQIANTTTFVAPEGSIPGVQARPANRGEFLTIYCTGLGEVSNRPATGAPASGNPLSTVLTPVTVTFSSGGTTATAIPSFAGLTPGFVALYQVNVQIPDNAPTGDAVVLKISQAGVDSNEVTIAVR